MFPSTVFQNGKVISCEFEIKIQKHMYSMTPTYFFVHTAYKNKKPNYTLF
jgi:hypothetical protein